MYLRVQAYAQYHFIYRESQRPGVRHTRPLSCQLMSVIARFPPEDAVLCAECAVLRDDYDVMLEVMDVHLRGKERERARSGLALVAFECRRWACLLELAKRDVWPFGPGMELVDVSREFAETVGMWGKAELAELLLRARPDLRLPLVLAAVKCGNVACLARIREHVLLCGEVATRAAVEVGRMDSLEHLHNAGCAWNASATYAAADKGRLELLKYLHQAGCPWDRDATYAAARMGHLECLKYLHEQGCPWDETTLYSAARMGHVECVEYLREQGCPEPL